MREIALAFCVLLCGALPVFSQGSERVVKARGYLSADAVRPGDKFKVAVVLEVAPGYHINAHEPSLDYLFPTVVKFNPPAGIRIGEPKYPAPIKRKFEFAPDTELAVHEGKVAIVADAEADAGLGPGQLTIGAAIEVQSCNDSQCLAPAKLDLQIPVRAIAAGQPANQINAEIFSGGQLIQYGGARPNEISELIESRGFFVALLLIFISGLALNATPCVYPIIPITIGFFANQSGSLRRTFSMAALYVLGMAMTYSALGVVASMGGGLFGGALQNPLVLVGLAALMVALALSMFGLYEFRLPEFLNRFATKGASTSGLIGALVMGLTMGIVAAPCIGPFVVALLVHVGTKGNPLYGFFMFFVLSLGLGLPYLVLGTFSGAIKKLPRSGEWMVAVRKVFGLALLGMALYFLMPLLGRYSASAFAVFFIASALYLIFWEGGRAKPKQFGWALRVLGAGAALAGILLVLPAKGEAGIEWQPYSDQALEEARRQNKPVIIDAYADWCIPCKELDKRTFTNREVRMESEQFVRLKLDLTLQDAGSQQWRAKERFGIIGVPTIIFLDSSGRELKDLRLEGFEPADRFLDRMRKALTSSGAEGEVLSWPLPDVELKLIDGGQLQLSALRGRVLLLDFWATWCVPCISEIPTFNQLYEEYKDRDFELIAISIDEGGDKVVKPFLRSHPIKYKVALGDVKLATEVFQIGDSLPVAYLVDRQGRIRFKHIGLTDKDAFKSEIEKLLSQ
jgi:thiol:disulfide interchange protein DsbD